MSKKSKRDEKLARQIIAEFQATGEKGDLLAFKRLLGTHGAHLPKTVKEDLIKDFKRNVALLREALRDD